MYIETKDNIHIIIDFKTDRVDNIKELEEKYKKQLLVYKRAIELLYSVDVDKLYIYSFSLNRMIEV